MLVHFVRAGVRAVAVKAHMGVETAILPAAAFIKSSVDLFRMLRRLTSLLIQYYRVGKPTKPWPVSVPGAVLG